MNRREVWRQLKKAARDQRGFTLIELLVVIAIMGILAAVVTFSMVGITNIALERAKATELQTVQVAYDTMLADEGVPTGTECQGAGGSSADMLTWPAGPAWDPVTPQHVPVNLAPHYIRGMSGVSGKTHGTYHCTGNGLILQDSYTP
jgi:prepilin-type N-terminal cleavage/methylation domain-containing protein